LSLLREEIAEQPAALARLLEEETAAVDALAAAIRRRRPRFVLIASRGTSENAARYAQHLFGWMNGLPVAHAMPALTTLYDTPPRLDRSLVLGISQSGVSPDVVGVVEEGRRQGQLTAAITNDEASPLAGVADHVISLRAGQERSVAATKTFTATLGALAALATAVAGLEERRAELDRMPAALARQLDLAASAGPAVAAARAWSHVVVIGRGPNLATAYEAALKIRELSGVVAEGYSPAGFRHGPIAVVGAGYPALAFAPAGPAREAVVELLAELRRRGGVAIVVAEDDAPVVSGDLWLPLVPVPEWLSPLVAAVPAQLLAAGLAEQRGVDVDAPFGLTKVTATR
jgi:glucosamine--fructose-6-phosphate aminotransferase (isomerizing)